MNKLFIAAGISALMATSAVAGGYTSSIVEVEPIAVVETPAFSWTGAYVGGTIARTSMDLDFSDFSDFSDASAADTSYGVLGGYRYQFENNFIIGAEGSYQKTDDMNDSGVDIEVWTAEVQAGYAFDRVLPYVSAGYAKVGGLESSTYGVGIDYAVTDNFVVGGKYNRTDLGDFNVTDNVFETVESFSADVETVSLRAIYKF